MTDVTQKKEALFTHSPIVLPGEVQLSDDLLREFHHIKQKRGESYTPRTRHLDEAGQPRYTNRLFLQSSPYLLQHAHNPVNWHPWGDEAFDEAQRLHRPVLLSVGYATCHWCHVMEEESFEDEEIARCLNENFIAIKVDREERPDVDQVYMNALQAMTGGGGWPLNVFLTPERIPFYGGTYYPPRDGDRGVLTGFLTLLKAISEAFHQKKEKVAESGKAILSAIKRIEAPVSGTRIPEDNRIQEAISFFKEHFDPEYGGIKGRIKFPSSLPIPLLLRRASRLDDQEARHMALHTLNKMADGGINDHVGGGFHRYATDEKWLVPHFEKMLYDNALIARAYTEAFQMTGEIRFEQITRSILDYVLKEMRAPSGGFYAATDADSQAPWGSREEGYFFTWVPEEVEAILGKEKRRIVQAFFAMEGPPTFDGRYILHTPRSIEKTAAALHMTEDGLARALQESIPLLYQEREKRSKPLRDEKILTSWNALMISAFARAGLSLNDSRYLEAARSAALFILDHIVIDGRLKRSHHEGKARLPAFLEDYAFFIEALIDLYEATFDGVWIERAIYFQALQKTHYYDTQGGGFFMTSHDHESLITRDKPAADSAIPSGNAVAVINLCRLHTLTGEEHYREEAEVSLRRFLGSDAVNPAAFSWMLMGLDLYLNPQKSNAP